MTAEKRQLLTPYISYGLFCPHLENPADFPKPVFIWRGSCSNTPHLIYINVTQHLKKSYVQNNKLLKTLFRQNVYLIIGVSIFTPIWYYIRKGENFVLDLLYVKILTVVIFIFNLPNVLILINYYQENKNTKIDIDLNSDEIIINNNGIKNEFKISEIKSSTYHLGIYYKNRIDNARRFKMMNSDLAYWDLEFNNGDRFFISNLLVDFLHDEPIVANTKFRFRMFQYINKSDSKEAVELKQVQEKRVVKKFTEKFESKTENELKEILSNRKSYQKEAVEAAELLMKNKNVG